VDVFKQLTDFRNAITFAQSQPEFDGPKGFGVWGSSFSGGLALVTAANDPRVTCVAVQVPNVSGHRNAKQLYSPQQLGEIQRRAEADRKVRLAGGAPDYVPMFSEDPDELCAFPGPLPEQYREALESEVFNNQTTVRSLENFIEFEPAGWIPYVTPKPMLMVLAEHDRCTFTEVQREVYDAAAEPKKLVTFDGGHFDAYSTFFDQTAHPARDWFVEYLAPVSAGDVTSASAPHSNLISN
jgi:fermentation-respiration switch protein FrsA (DUF1100 family)